jgi:hypothetical protein
VKTQNRYIKRFLFTAPTLKVGPDRHVSSRAEAPPRAEHARLGLREETKKSVVIRAIENRHDIQDGCAPNRLTRDGRSTEHRAARIQPRGQTGSPPTATNHTYVDPEGLLLLVAPSSPRLARTRAMSSHDVTGNAPQTIKGSTSPIHLAPAVRQTGATACTYPPLLPVRKDRPQSCV